MKGVTYMTEGLYPVFDIPTTDLEDEENQISYLPAPMFDFEQGDFIRDPLNRVVMCDGREAYQQWCTKMIGTELGACIAYTDCGISGEDAMAELTREGIQTAYQRTITEALMMHPNTERIYDFEFEWSGDEMAIAFTVEGKDRAIFGINMNVIV